MSSVFDAVVFDFDYTLADSATAVVECINYALRGLGLPAASAGRARRTIGMTLPNTFLRLAGREHTEKCADFTRLFIERADEVMVDMTALFGSVPETIRILKRNGIMLGIVSTKFRHRLQTIMKRENLLDAFDAIVGGEDVSKHKPDPAGLVEAIQRLESLPSGALYVGDSTIDAETAVRAGIPFVAVLSGVTTREDFKGYPVYGIIKSLPELPELLGCR